MNARTVADPGVVPDLGAQIEAAGFGGIAVAGFGGGLAYALSFAHHTRAIPIFTCIQPIYLAHPIEVARQANHVLAVADGRFALGLGVSHAPMLEAAGVTAKPPIQAMRDYVAGVRDAGYGGLVYLAAVRDRMLELAADIADGALLAHAAIGPTAARIENLRRRCRDEFLVGTVLATAIHDDAAVAEGAVREYLAKVYARLPNYRSYWRSAGFESEIDQVEAALAAGDQGAVAAGFSDRLLRECCLAGTPADIGARLGRWFDAGVDVPILQLVEGAECPQDHLADAAALFRRAEVGQ